MPDVYPVLVCFGFLFLLIPVIVSIVAMVRVGQLGERVRSLEMRLADLAREMVRLSRAGEAGKEAPRRMEDVEKPAADAGAASRPITVAPAQARAAAPVLPKLQPAMAVERPVPMAPPMPAEPKPVAPPVAVVWAARPPVSPRMPLPPMAVASAPRRSLESYLIPVFIVIGSIVLALAAIFLVKIGIERGVFGPAARDWATVMAAFVLVGLGQWWRKRLGFWSQGLIGAGLVSFFSGVYAATSRHGFIQPVWGFILLGAATAAAVAMSLQDWSAATESKKRGGILIASLGLIGGFLTPILINTGRDDVPGLFGYLILLHVGLIAATRIRGWSVLAAASTVLSSLWLICWVLLKWNPAATPQDGTILGLFMLASVASLVVATATQPERWSGGKSRIAANVLTWLAVGFGILAACLLVGRSNFDNMQWAFFAILTAGAFVLARLRPAYEAMAWLASAVVLAMLAGWGFSVEVRGMEVSATLVAEHLRFRNWLAGFGIVSVLAAYACQWKSAAPYRWALLAGLETIAYVLIAYGLVPSAPRPDEWAYLPLAAAGALAMLMVPALVQRKTMVAAEATLTVYAHGILVLLLIAPPMALEGGTLTAAWAAVIPLTALAMWRVRLPGLVVGLLWAMVVLAVRALLIGTVVDAGGPGRSLVWNPVVWAYGSSVIALALGAWLVERCEELPETLREGHALTKTAAALLQVGAAVAAFLLVTLEVRWGFHDGQLDRHSARLMELSTFAVGGLLLAAALTWIGSQIQRVVLVRCGQVAGILAATYAVFGLVVVANPIWWFVGGQGENVGSMPVLNLLLYEYGAPAALCALAAWVWYRSDPENRSIGRIVAAAGMVLLFALVSLEVCQGFHGASLYRSDFNFTERATYPMAWFVIGGVLLALGYRFQWVMVRRGGLAFVTIALAFALLAGTLILNPLVTRDRVGATPIFNGLMYAYGIPAVITACLAWFLWKLAPKYGGTRTERVLAWCNAIASLVFIFALVTLEVQHCFRGDRLFFGASPAGTPAGEIAAYSIAWALLGFVYLIVGIMRRSVLLRAASLGMMLLTIPKIFLFDIVVTEDFQRVLSFTGVGVSLLALAFVYHRFVFRRSELPEGAVEGQSDIPS